MPFENERNSGSPVSWGCRIHRLHLCRGIRPPPNKCLGYNTKQSDGAVPVMLELWGTRSSPSLSQLPGRLWLGVVASDRVLSISQIELKCVLMLNWITWNKTVLIFKLRTVLFEMELFLTLKLCLRWTELFEIELFWRLTVRRQKLYLYQTELFELELFD